MFERLLAPLDLSDRHRPTIDALAGLARRGGAQVHLLHVIEAIEGAEYEELEDFYSTLRERAVAALDRWRGLLKEQGVEAQCEIRLGKRGPEIVRFAQELGCDLIVLGSHAVDPADPRRGLGTLSQQIALVAPCSVLLVRSGASTPSA